MTIKSRIIEFPSINWDELKKGALSKDRVWDEIDKGVKFLLEVRMLKRTNFLSRDTIKQSREIERKLSELKEQYPQVTRTIQNLLGRKIKEWAEKDGDSKTLFGRLQTLVLEARFHGCLKEWEEKDLEKVPLGLRKNFEVRLYNPRTKQTRYFLPTSWRNETHKRTALVLRDLSFKARDTYRAERGIKSETPPPEVPKTPKNPKKISKKTKTTTKTAKKEKKKKLKRSPVKKGARGAHKADARKDIDKKEILEAKKVGSFADIGKLVPKK